MSNTHKKRIEFITLHSQVFIALIAPVLSILLFTLWGADKLALKASSIGIACCTILAITGIILALSREKDSGHDSYSAEMGFRIGVIYTLISVALGGFISFLGSL